MLLFSENFSRFLVLEFFNELGRVFIIVQFKIGTVFKVVKINIAAGDALLSISLRSQHQEWICWRQNGVKHLSINNMNNQASTGHQPIHAIIEKLHLIFNVI